MKTTYDHQSTYSAIVARIAAGESVLPGEINQPLAIITHSYGELVRARGILAGKRLALHRKVTEKLSLLAKSNDPTTGKQYAYNKAEVESKAGPEQAAVDKADAEILELEGDIAATLQYINTLKAMRDRQKSLIDQE